MNEPASEPTSFRRVAQRVSLLAGALVFAVVCGGVSAADTAAAGDFSRSVVVDGVKRHYLVHVPPAERSNAPVPVVLLLHGGYGSAVGVTRVTGGFQALADRAGFIAVYPDAKGNHWDDGRETLMSRTNDVAFIAVLLDTLAAEHRIDAQRVYAVGISNGGMMTLRLACELSNRFAAVATVAANMPAALVPACHPARAVPLVMFSGTADPLMPYAGGKVAGLAGGRVLSAPETAAFWARAHRLAESPQTSALPDADASDGTTTDLLSFGAGEVALYRINEGGHTWPGGTQYLPARFVGRLGRDFSANELMWAFFSRHTLP